MRLLITTQVLDMDDPVLGFFHRWLFEFSKHVEAIEVICLREGKHQLPEHVHVHSLGKERGKGSRLRYLVRLFSLLRKLDGRYDAVFVHMNPEYLILCGWIWKLKRTRTALWYVHKKVDLKLRLATWFADRTLSASRESFQLKSSKVEIIGHGIPMDNPPCPVRMNGAELRFITVGRITPAKGIDSMLDSLQVFAQEHERFSFDIIGAPALPEDHDYLEALKVRTQNLPFEVRFLGPKHHTEIPRLMCDYDLFLHASRGTGSIDKAVLESLAMGVPVVSSSNAFRELLAPYGLFVESPDPTSFAEAMTRFLDRTDRQECRERLIERVRHDYDLEALIPRILATLSIN